MPVATEAELSTVRQMTAETADSSPFTDADLNEIIGEAASLREAAAEVWERKAAQAAGLVNTNESGSSRALGDLAKQYLDMATTYRSSDEATAGGVRSATTRRITRL
jgi:hypothetical protein